LPSASIGPTLDAHAVLDFPDVLLYTLKLLGQMEEFSQSRYRLESRYHHVLVDEFQDTSRAQWELVSLLVRAWGEGAGLAYQGPLEPTVFIVGDRKQSIYGFRDADVAVLGEAGRAIAQLRPGGDVRRSISRSFRSVPALLSFVNDVCADIDKLPARTDAFAYGEDDVFPVDIPSAPYPRSVWSRDRTSKRVPPPPPPRLPRSSGTASRFATGTRAWRAPSVPATWPSSSGPARAIASSRTRWRWPDCRRTSTRGSGSSTPTRSRTCWRCCGISPNRRPTCALPHSFARASCGCRTRRCAAWPPALPTPSYVERNLQSPPEPADPPLDPADQARLAAARTSTARWRARADRMPPAELIDLVLHESAYGIELRGARFQQARENLKKFRALLRRIQNRGYSTLGRIASHLDRLAVGDESNASLDATNAVNLMTVHAAKGLEFPVVFLVNLARGTGNRRDYIRIGTQQGQRHCAGRGVGGGGRLHLGVRRRRAGARTRRDQAAPLRGAHTGARPPLPELGAQGRACGRGTRQPGGRAAARR
jgi:hypothetical protein